MDDLHQLALAGLVHDLPRLFEITNIPITEHIQKVLSFASLNQSLKDLLDMAERYAMPEDRDRELALKQPLISIFSRVQLHQKTEPPTYSYPFAPLPSVKEAQEAIFPTLISQKNGLLDLLNNLADELNWLGSSVDLERFERVYAHLMAILQRFTWCIPSHSQDVSLFDHAKLTSAIAVCLYHHREQSPELEVPFCLVVGDLSGIQEYIFDITNIGAGGVARRLRARSFYISALSDVVSHMVAIQFGIPLGNILMSSGGKFYVLVPNRLDLYSQIEDLRQLIDGWFRTQFNGEIAINLAYEIFQGEDFQAGNPLQRGFGDVLTELNLKLNREKRQRGQGVLAQNGEWSESAFIIERDYWGVGVCVSCRKFPANRPENLCEQCDRDRRTGRKLPSVQYVGYYRDQPLSEDDLRMPGDYSVRVLSQEDIGQAGDPYLIARLNHPNLRSLKDHPASFRYLANYVPIEHGEQLSFEDIAKTQGRALLGYVKADVDYLGLLFAQGLRRDDGGYDTAAHLAAFSRELDLFFSGWIQHLLSNTSDYSHFYTIFSGGDDLYLVGPWDKAADLARAVQRKFTEFVSHNPEITISSGILFTKDSYPISRASKDAEETLELSKEREYLDETGFQRKRNQITILGDTFRWELAPLIFSEINTLKERLGVLKSAFLYNLIEYDRLYKLWKVERKIEGIRYKSLFAYNIARNLRKDDETLYNWADNLLQSLHGDKENLTMEHLGLIATYLLFMKRGEKNARMDTNP